MKPTFHRDGSVSYWSVVSQQWVRQSLSSIPDRELSAMTLAERERIVTARKS